MDDYPAFMLQSCPLMANFMARRKDLIARLKFMVETRTDNAYADLAIAQVAAWLKGR